MFLLSPCALCLISMSKFFMTQGMDIIRLETGKDNSLIHSWSNLLLIISREIRNKNQRFRISSLGDLGPFWNCSLTLVVHCGDL